VESKPDQDKKIDEKKKHDENEMAISWDNKDPSMSHQDINEIVPQTLNAENEVNLVIH
jgi:hypothetical protein